MKTFLSRSRSKCRGGGTGILSRVSTSARLRALERENQRLRRLVITDDLTGAYNRRYFSEMIRAALKKRTREGAVALCLLDVDDFKAVNDRYGHRIGDEMLRRLSHVLRREGDALCRLGGDEFAAVMVVHSKSAAKAHAGRLLEAVRAIEPMPTESGPLQITVTAGVAWVGPEADANWKQMFEDADKALYRAKQAGKNCVVVLAGEEEPVLADEQNVPVVERNVLMAD